jgi:hypothetical protein
MRSVVFLVSLICPAIASGQSLFVQGSAGPTLFDAGYTAAVGAGVSPWSHVSLLFNLERTHLSSRLSSDGRGGFSGFRGGTVTSGGGEVRVTVLDGSRTGPYGLAGFIVGVSKPTVNDMFPDPATNEVRAMVFGGGVHVPLTEPLAFFADVRMMIGAEAGETLAIVPVRAGIQWRF